MALVPLGDGAGQNQWLIEHAGRSFAVFAVGGLHYVTEAACPHNGGPLVEGTIRDERTLVCPWHWFRYDLATGDCKNLDRYHLATYRVREQDGELFAEVPEPAPERSWSEVLREHGG